MSDRLLATEGLTRRFGGFVAVDSVGLEVRRGEIHAIIGPNGAGKTTLLNLLSGELPPSAGRILFDGRDVTTLPPDRRARLGLGRSFQHASLFDRFAMFENVRLAAQSRLVPALRFFGAAVRHGPVNVAARDSLQTLALTEPHRRAGEISHGEQRQLEIAMLLATEPSLLLLDEPTSGMGRAETQALIGTLRQLAARHTLVLVEHDLDVVFTLADRISVLIYGKLLASGSPAEIRADTAVRAAYLGTRGDAA